MLMQQPGQFPLWMQAIGGNSPALRQIMQQPMQQPAPAAAPPAPPPPPVPGMSPGAQAQIDATRGALVGPNQGQPAAPPAPDPNAPTNPGAAVPPPPPAANVGAPGAPAGFNFAQMIQPAVLQQLQQMLQQRQMGPQQPFPQGAFPGANAQPLGPFQNPLQDLMRRMQPQNPLDQFRGQLPGQQPGGFPPMPGQPAGGQPMQFQPMRDVAILQGPSSLPQGQGGFSNMVYGHG